MTMDKLWAPWRAAYITQILKEDRSCVFCRMLQEKKDKKNYILIRRKYAYAVLNIYPYNNGHFLIVTNRHADDLGKLLKEEREDVFDLLEEVKGLLQKTLTPDGYNIGINLGKAAGAGFPKHLHIHLVPRWRGDVNFMPVTADTKVISQSLKVLYQKLSHACQRRH